MRKIALLAMLAIVAAMVPMTTASSQLDGVGTVHIINSVSGPLDICIEVDDGNFHKFAAFPGPSAENFNVPKGSHDYRVSPVNPTPANADCSVGTLTSDTFSIESNDNLSFVVALGGTFVYIAENNTDSTETEEARLTAHNVLGGGLVSICVDGEPVITNVSFPGSGEEDFDAKDGEEQDVLFFLGGPFPGSCDPGLATVETQLNFPPGTNLINAFANFGVCTSACGDLLIVGEEPPSSEQLVDPFCAVIFDLPAAQAELTALFAEIEVGDPDTYPSADEVEKVVTKLIELIDNGNELVPDDIADAWHTLTAGIAQIGALAAVDFDLEALPQDRLSQIVEGIDNPPASDEEEAAAEAELTAWVPVNCFAAVETEPTFTG